MEVMPHEPERVDPDLAQYVPGVDVLEIDGDQVVLRVGERQRRRTGRLERMVVEAGDRRDEVVVCRIRAAP